MWATEPPDVESRQSIPQSIPQSMQSIPQVEPIPQSIPQSIPQVEPIPQSIPQSIPQVEPMPQSIPQVEPIPPLLAIQPQLLRWLTPFTARRQRRRVRRPSPLPTAEVRRLARRGGSVRVPSVDYSYRPAVREPGDRVQDPGEWREMRLGRAEDRATRIDKLVRGKWVPWLVAAPSALLAQRGIEGRGLYTARTLEAGDHIGTYGGRVVAYCEDLDLTQHSHQGQLVHALAQAGHDKMVLRTRKHGDCMVIDGQDQGLPHLNLINDPSFPGDPSDQADETVHLYPAGTIRAADHLGKYNVRWPWSENGGSELLMRYGNDFWKVFGTKT
jgi:hypothetical protein